MSQQALNGVSSYLGDNLPWTPTAKNETCIGTVTLCAHKRALGASNHFNCLWFIITGEGVGRCADISWKICVILQISGIVFFQIIFLHSLNYKH